MNVRHIIDRMPPYKIANYITHPRKMSYNAWLHSPVSSCGTEWVCNDGSYYTHEDFLRKVHLCYDIRINI